MKIHIVGAPGSGKTTLARQLAANLQCPHIELDALYWGPQWTPVATESFQRTVAQRVQESTWVMDGSYDSVRPLIWHYADMVIWLDYPQWFRFKRLLWRNINHALRKTNLWGSGNCETLLWLLGPNSIILRSLKKHRTLRRRYPALMTAAEYAHIDFIRLCSHQATQRWFISFVHNHSVAVASGQQMHARNQRAPHSLAFSR